MMQQGLKQTLRNTLNKQVRPPWQALRGRGDLSVLAQVMRGTLGLRHQAGPNHEHLAAAMGWLCTAHDTTADDGVSAFYDVAQGRWAPSYPETTGYIIPTFFDYAVFSGEESYRQRALRMAEWLLTLQLDSGAFPMGPLWEDLERKPIVFDTGQIMHGLVRTFEETEDSRFLDAAKRAADWLTDILEPDGSWRKHTFLEHVHTYNARVTWAVARVYKATGVEKYRQTALRNLAWVMAQQTTDGWFDNAAFSPGEEALTHTLAYTIRGLLESGRILENQPMIDAARQAADALRHRQAEDGYLRGTYGPGWRSSVSYSCLTGDVQMAIIWFELYKLTSHWPYLKAARAANRYVKEVQGQQTGQPGIDGGVAGSFPIYGDYHAYLYVNWAAKFLVDSLLLEEQLATINEEDVDEDC